MDDVFGKIKVGILSDHFDHLGGGVTHSFKIIEFLKEFYSCDVYISGTAKTVKWAQDYLNIDTKDVNFIPYRQGIGERYNYLFLNISHWRAERTEALKQYMLVFFPQFDFPRYDYNFIANSEYTKENIIEKWRGKESAITVIYPPIMTSSFVPGKNKKNYILHVSRISKPRPEADKGHRQMIRTFKEMVDGGLKNWEFHLVGQVQDTDYHRELVSMATGYPITIHESLPFDELKKLYAESKIYWHLTGITMPSEAGAQEHFGMTTVEAMSAGCVPVSLSTGGQPEIITNGSGFLVDNLRGLVVRTEELIKDSNKLKKMSDKAIERSKLFDVSIARQGIFDLVSRTNKVSIIVLNHNESGLLKNCVDRLYEVTPPGFELIIVDNGSNPVERETVRKLMDKYSKSGHNIKAIYNRGNRGFAIGNNMGLKIATKPYICYLNNDTTPQWGWLERMVDVLETKPKAAIVGARLYYPKSPRQTEWKIQHAGVEFDSEHNPKHIGWHQPDNMVRTRGIEEMEAVTGACLLVRRELAKLNENFIRGYYEDTDLCLRVREKGWKVYINHEARLIHLEGGTLRKMRAKDKTTFNRISAENKELFHKMWDKRISKLPRVSSKLDTSGVAAIRDVEIGGGDAPLYPDYTQVDLRNIKGVSLNFDARALPFGDNTLARICSCYMLQCLPEEEALISLREWHRCLEPGGRLELHVPNLDRIMRQFISTEDENLLDEIYGQQRHPLDFYQHGWTDRTLERLLSRANFVRFRLLDPPAIRPHALSVEVYKSKNQ